MTTVTIREANQGGVQMYEISVRPATGAGEHLMYLTHEQAGALTAALRVFTFSELQAVTLTAETRPAR